MRDLQPEEAKEAAMKIAANDFLNYELDMPQYEIDVLEIVKTYFFHYPASRTLDIEITDSNTAAQIPRRAERIDKENNPKDKPSLEKYIPPHIYNKYIGENNHF